MQTLSLHLAALTSAAEVLLRARKDSLAVTSMGPGRWSFLELLGHLIDSAANNHQRFVRALIEPELLEFPGYAQEEFVEVQRYAAADPELLITLFASSNRLIAWILEGIPEDKLGTRCVIGGEQTTLGRLASDYVAHLEHHLRQLLGPDALPWSGLPWPPPAVTLEE